MARRSKVFLDPIAVEAGQRYLIKRHGKPALVVRILEVRRGLTKEGAQPKCWYRALTKHGTPRKKTSSYDQTRVPCWLTYRDGAWRFPHGEEIR